MKFLRQAKIQAGTHVLVRVDFNVDFDKSGRILDAYRIGNTLPTIRWLMARKAKVILLTHLGGPRQPLVHRSSNSTKPLVRYLSKILKGSVKFAPRCFGGPTRLLVRELKPGEVLLLENIRFEPSEVANDPSFAAKLAQLADLYVFDAFGVAHRAHASMSLLPRLLPSYGGLLLEKELKILSSLVKKPKHPLVFVLGGAKISTKLPILSRFIRVADHILVGGALANTLLKIRGFETGSSLVENIVDSHKAGKLSFNSPKILLPVDVRTAKKNTSRKFFERSIENVPKSEMILDIGPKTVQIFSDVVRKARMVFWNGPVGYIEKPVFAKGTKVLAQAIEKSRAFSVVGGGDTLVLLHQMGILKKFDFVSTGGGAMLSFLAGERLPALEALGYYKKSKSK